MYSQGMSNTGWYFRSIYQSPKSWFVGNKVQIPRKQFVLIAMKYPPSTTFNVTYYINGDDTESAPLKQAKSFEEIAYSKEDYYTNLTKWGCYQDRSNLPNKYWATICNDTGGVGPAWYWDGSDYFYLRIVSGIFITRAWYYDWDTRPRYWENEGIRLWDTAWSFYFQVEANCDGCTSSYDGFYDVDDSIPSKLASQNWDCTGTYLECDDEVTLVTATTTTTVTTTVTTGNSNSNSNTNTNSFTTTEMAIAETEETAETTTVTSDNSNSNSHTNSFTTTELAIAETAQTAQTANTDENENETSEGGSNKDDGGIVAVIVVAGILGAMIIIGGGLIAANKFGILSFGSSSNAAAGGSTNVANQGTNGESTTTDGSKASAPISINTNLDTNVNGEQGEQVGSRSPSPPGTPTGQENSIEIRGGFV